MYDNSRLVSSAGVRSHLVTLDVAGIEQTPIHMIQGHRAPEYLTLTQKAASAKLAGLQSCQQQPCSMYSCSVFCASGTARESHFTFTSAFYGCDNRVILRVCRVVRLCESLVFIVFSIKFRVSWKVYIRRVFGWFRLLTTMDKVGKYSAMLANSIKG